MDKPTILAVDDQKSNRAIIESRLKDQYNVILASNGHEALGILQTTQIDLILLDIMLGDQNGIELCRTIKKNNITANIPVIFLTGVSNQNQIEDGFNAGGSDYIIKNFNTSELKLRIKNQLKLVELSRLLQEGLNNIQKSVQPSEEFKQELAEIHDNLEKISSGINKSCQQLRRLREIYP